MAFKFISGLCILAVATSALPLDYLEQASVEGLTHGGAYISPSIAPVYGGHLIQDSSQGYYEAKHAPIDYEFQYGVHDEHTGDIKSQAEERKDGVVRGRYELIDADGYRRIVEYTADDEHGFRATVRREPLNIKVATPEPYHFDVKRSVKPEVTYGSVGATVSTPKQYSAYTTAAPTKYFRPADDILGTAAAYLKGLEDPLTGLSPNYGPK